MAKTIGSFDLASLKNLRDDVTQYFWFESNSSSAWGSGAHVTLYPESQFTDSTSPNYMKGQNIIMNTDGFSIRNGALPMMVLDNDSLDFNAVDTSAGTYTTMATFGLTGATIGQTSNAHSVIDADGQRFYASDGTTQLANIGYGEGQAQTGTAIAPYYTFGIRASGGTIGNYSMAEGDITTASGVFSHAEGRETTASGQDSHAEGRETTAHGPDSHAEGNSTTASGGTAHAEGYGTTASGGQSHAEGNGTTASGRYSHAEGYHTTASGATAHAGGRNTIAQRMSQTAIGEYNIEDTTGADGGVRGDYAFIIGNGTADDARSNALTVDWSGNTKMAGTLTMLDHDSPVGFYETKSDTVNKLTGTSFASISGSAYTPSAGRWLITASARYSGATTGNRGVAVYEAGTVLSSSQVIVPAIQSSSWATDLKTVQYVNTDGTKEYRIGLLQSSGNSLSTSYSLTFVRIR